jgi:hypothetical protein
MAPIYVPLASTEASYVTGMVYDATAAISESFKALFTAPGPRP